MLVSGLGILIVTQAMIHILVNVGVLPVTGQTLPFISLGGSSIMAVGLAFGMMLSVSRALENERLYELELTEKEKRELMKDETEPKS